MRQGRSSKQETDQLMEIDDLSKLKEEPHHLSGAYIRSLVKQLTSSRTKDTMNSKDLLDCSTKFGEGFSETKNTQQPHQQPQQHKKQVRRRLHTSRPYQERLLNMAEARREIVTALKFHRAAMKQASEQQQQHQEPEQQPQLQQLLPQPHPYSEQEGMIKSRRNPRIYPSNSANYLETLPYSSNFSHQYSSVPNQFSWSSASRIPPPPVYENFDFTALPSQTLGLNLNFQDFNNINTTLYHNSNSPPFYSTSGSVSFSASASSPSSSSSPSLSIATDHELPGSSAAVSHMEMEAPAVADTTDSGITTSGGEGLHAAMDDEEMAEIRSIGEQHQMEWNDTMNLVTSAWWFKFLQAEDDDGYHLPFDEAMEFPAWLNANEGSFQQHLNDYYSADYFQDPALPCMDIGEFEGFDGEWLA